MRTTKNTNYEKYFKTKVEIRFPMIPEKLIIVQKVLKK